MLFAYLNIDVNSLKICILIEELELDCKYFNRYLCKNNSGRFDNDTPLIIDGANIVSGTENILIYLSEKWGVYNETPLQKYKIAAWLLKFKNKFLIKKPCSDNEFASRWDTDLNNIDIEIDKNGFLVSSEFTIADISFWSELYKLEPSTLNFYLSKYKNIGNFYKKLSLMNSIIRAKYIINNDITNGASGFSLRTGREIQEIGGLDAF